MPDSEDFIDDTAGPPGPMILRPIAFIEIRRKMPLTFDSVVKRNAGLLSTQLGEDIIILNPLRDNYIGLDEIGGRVWALLAAPIKVDRLCGDVVQQYQGDRQQIPADLIAFLNELDGEGLLEVE